MGLGSSHGLCECAEHGIRKKAGYCATHIGKGNGLYAKRGKQALVSDICARPRAVTYYGPDFPLYCNYVYYIYCSDYSYYVNILHCIYEDSRDVASYYHNIMVLV